MDDTIRELIARVPDWAGKEAEATPLSGGITNQNYRVDAGGESFVLRVLSKSTDHLGIVRDHEFACSRIAAELGIGPEVIHYAPDDGILAVRFVDARPVSPEETRDPATLARIVATIRRYHEGPRFPGEFSAFETVRAYHRRALESDVRFPETLPRLFALMERVEAALDDGRAPVPCHNDLLAANFLDDGERIWIIDWEYGGMGDPYFDLGNFAVNQELDDERKELLLETYFGASGPGRRAHLELMTLASDMREAFWGFLQSGVGTLDFDYHEYGRKHLDRVLARAADARFETWIANASKG